MKNMKNKIALGIGISFVTASIITLSPSAHAAQSNQSQVIKTPEKTETVASGGGATSTLKINKNGGNIKKKTTQKLSTNTKTVKQRKANTTPKKIKATNEKKQLGTSNGETRKNGARRAPPTTTP